MFIPGASALCRISLVTSVREPWEELVLGPDPNPKTDKQSSFCYNTLYSIKNQYAKNQDGKQKESLFSALKNQWLQFAINILYRNYMFMYYTLCYKKIMKSFIKLCLHFFW